MKNKAFTLIELLVVVLIIGILAAIAVPQYQKSIDKSRFIKYLQVAYSIKKAQEVYYLSNGEYSTDLTALDIDYSAGCVNVVGKNIWQCPDGFLIDIGLGYGKAIGVIEVTFCPNHNDSYSSCYSNPIASCDIYFDKPINRPEMAGASSCQGYTARGEHICNTLSNI